jgi:hypothetical protein
VRAHVGPGFREHPGVVLAIESADQQALLAQLLSVEEIDLASLKAGAIEAVLDDDQVGVPQAIRALNQAKTSLLVQRWIVAEPDDDRTGVCVKLVMVIAVKECLEDCSRHHGLAGTSCGCQRECVPVAVLAPPLVGLA